MSSWKWEVEHWLPGARGMQRHWQKGHNSSVRRLSSGPLAYRAESRTNKHVFHVWDLLWVDLNMIAHAHAHTHCLCNGSLLIPSLHKVYIQTSCQTSLMGIFTLSVGFVWLCDFMYVCMMRPEEGLVSSFVTLPYSPETGSLTALEVCRSGCADWPASPCLHLPTLGNSHMWRSLTSSCECWRFKLGPLCLQRKHSYPLGHLPDFQTICFGSSITLERGLTAGVV